MTIKLLGFSAGCLTAELLCGVLTGHFHWQLLIGSIFGAVAFTAADRWIEKEMNS